MSQPGTNQRVPHASEPEVSVIIPCFMADAFVPVQLSALAAQVDAPVFEVLLADNGGNLNLVDLAIDFSVQTGHPARVVDATARKGTAYARNQGIAQARGRKLLFCDADDVVMPTWVQLGARQLDRTSAFSGGAIPVAASIVDRGVDAVVAEVSPQLEPERDNLHASGSAEYPILMGGSCGMTRELALRVGGFDESFHGQGEDNDLAFRLVRELGFLPDASHACIAYRTRPETEVAWQRAFDSGFKHALLCARHQAWSHSPAYRGKWALRPVRLVADALRTRHLDKADLGRQLGLIAGWMRYRAGWNVPPPQTLTASQP